MVGLFILIALFHRIIVPFVIDYDQQVIYQDTSRRLQDPSKEHIMVRMYMVGIFVRALWEQGIFTIGFVAVGVSIIIGEQLESYQHTLRSIR